MRLAVTAVALTFALGCGSGSAPDKKDDPKSTNPQRLQGTPTPPTPTDPKAAAQKFVSDFFAALKAKTATPEQLTTEFKKVIAPPFGADPAGFSEVRAQDYLNDRAAVTADQPKVEVADEVAFAAGNPGPGGRVLLRLVKVGGAWQVDWLSNGPATAEAVTLNGPEGIAGVGFAAAAFADAAMTKNYTLVAAAMTLPGKARIAPPFRADADADRGFNRGLLTDAVVAAFGSADRATLAGITREKDAATVKLNLTAGDKKTELTLTLVKGPRPGVWLVDRFDAK